MLEKTLVFILFAVSARMKQLKEESIYILKIIGLIENV